MYVYISIRNGGQKKKNACLNLFAFMSENVCYYSDQFVSCLTFFLSVSFRTQIRQHEFREQFRTEPIFSINIDEPYKLLDKVLITLAV